MTTTRLATFVDRVETCPGAERLESGRGSMGLFQLVEDLVKVGLRVS